VNASRFIEGDNLVAMHALYKAGHRFALVYADAPFMTNKSWVTTDGEIAYEDKWPSLGNFVATIRDTMQEAWDLLLPEGSLVLHVDPTTSHYLKVALDDVLGREHFANEIIWRYRRWPTPSKNFQWMHDVLLRYVKTPGASRWNQLYEPLSLSTTHTWKQSKQRAVMADGAKGKAVRARSAATSEDSPGAAMSDVWDIPIVAPSGDERTGYPTQKPEALLQRLILATTNECDAVLDPYSGSGTTACVAARLGRIGVGIDSSPVAVRVSRKRLAGVMAQPSLFERVKLAPRDPEPVDQEGPT
jgi:DNA modification methylase